MGTLVSALGVYLSVVIDLPTGATIVCTFGGVLLLMFVVHLILYHRKANRQVADPAPR
jgi:zinc/manganese transport system permease protein